MLRIWQLLRCSGGAAEQRDGGHGNSIERVCAAADLPTWRAVGRDRRGSIRLPGARLYSADPNVKRSIEPEKCRSRPVPGSFENNLYRVIVGLVAVDQHRSPLPVRALDGTGRDQVVSDGRTKVASPLPDQTLTACGHGANVRHSGSGRNEEPALHGAGRISNSILTSSLTLTVPPAIRMGLMPKALNLKDADPR